MNAWAMLVERYADGRAICNCGDAYYTNCGTANLPDGEGGWKRVTDAPACQYGCEANRSAAKQEIAERVVRELLKVRP